MVDIPYEVGALTTIAFFLAFFAVINTMIPADLQIVSTFDFVWFGGGMIGVAGSCAVLTGIPCAIALVVFGVLSLLAYIFVFNSLIKLAIFLPMTIIIVYLVSRLARGGG